MSEVEFAHQNNTIKILWGVPGGDPLIDEYVYQSKEGAERYYEQTLRWNILRFLEAIAHHTEIYDLRGRFWKTEEHAKLISGIKYFHGHEVPLLSMCKMILKLEKQLVSLVGSVPAGLAQQWVEVVISECHKVIKEDSPFSELR